MTKIFVVVCSVVFCLLLIILVNPELREKIHNIASVDYAGKAFLQHGNNGLKYEVGNKSGDWETNALEWLRKNGNYERMAVDLSEQINMVSQNNTYFKMLIGKNLVKSKHDHLLMVWNEIFYAFMLDEQLAKNYSVEVSSVGLLKSISPRDKIHSQTIVNFKSIEVNLPIHPEGDITGTASFSTLEEIKEDISLRLNCICTSHCFISSSFYYPENNAISSGIIYFDFPNREKEEGLSYPVLAFIDAVMFINDELNNQSNNPGLREYEVISEGIPVLLYSTK